MSTVRTLLAIMERYNLEVVRNDPRFPEASGYMRELRKHAGDMLSPENELTDPVRDLADKAGRLIQHLADDYGLEFSQVMRMASER